MVELTCDSCDKTKEFPDVLTVVTDEITGWELDVETSDDVLKVTDAYCLDCQ